MILKRDTFRYTSGRWLPQQYL
uniref:Uncharacterized protein n=1 Tax=Anguilla anguilla TaxID=7936 RepID=A0A0E9UDW6_ANGAN